MGPLLLYGPGQKQDNKYLSHPYRADGAVVAVVAFFLFGYRFSLMSLGVNRPIAQTASYHKRSSGFRCDSAEIQGPQENHYENQCPNESRRPG